MAKGGAYERDVCRQLSLWFSGGKTDDWYWRASQSGGRATVRGRKGKTTTGHHGDVAPCCPEACVLTDLITFEVKRGYNRSAHLVDLLDRKVWPTGKGRKETILGMIEQAIRAAEGARTHYWALVHKRDGREPLVYLPRSLAYRLVSEFHTPILDFVVNVGKKDLGIVGVRFADFLNVANPATVRGLAKRRAK